MDDCCLQLFRVCHLANTIIWSILLSWHDWYLIIGSILALCITATHLLCILFLLLIWAYIYLLLLLLPLSSLVVWICILSFTFLLICWFTADFFLYWYMFTATAWLVLLLPNLILPHDVMFCHWHKSRSEYQLWVRADHWLCDFVDSICSIDIVYTSKSIRCFTYCSH